MLQTKINRKKKKNQIKSMEI